MMNNRINSKQYISAFQYTCIVTGTMLALGALSIGRIAVDAAGRDGWISVLLAGIIILIDCKLLLILARKFPDMTFFEYSEVILGKIPGKLVSMVFTALTALVCGISIRMTSYMVNTWVLLFTPRYIIYITMLSLCVYLSLKELKVLGRVTSILYFVLFPLGLLFIPPVYGSSELLNILPMGETGVTGILRGTAACIYCFAGYETLLVYYPFVNDKEKGESYTLAGIFYIVFLYVTAVFTQILVYDLKVLQRMWVPSINFISIVSIPFFERLDILFLILWISVFFKTLSVNYYTTTIAVEQVFCLKDRKMVCLLLAPVVLYISTVPQNTIQLQSYIYITGFAIIIFTLILPLLLLIISIILKRGK